MSGFVVAPTLVDANVAMQCSPEEFNDHVTSFLRSPHYDTPVRLSVNGDITEWTFFSKVVIRDHNDQYDELILRREVDKQYSKYVCVHAFDDELVEFMQRVLTQDDTKNGHLSHKQRFLLLNG